MPATVRRWAIGSEAIEFSKAGSVSSADFGLEETWVSVVSAFADGGASGERVVASLAGGSARVGLSASDWVGSGVAGAEFGLFFSGELQPWIGRRRAIANKGNATIRKRLCLDGLSVNLAMLRNASVNFNAVIFGDKCPVCIKKPRNLLQL